MSANGKKKRRSPSAQRRSRQIVPRSRRALAPRMLDPEAPGLDDETRRRRRALAKMQQLSVEELFQIAVSAGIYTEDGELTAPYRSDEPSAYRPMD